jgi:hypothetical protein
MLHCPTNLENLLEDSNARFPKAQDKFHHYFSLKCTCNGAKFCLLESNRRSVIAVCDRCGRELRIYDLAFYTSATKAKGDETFEQVLTPVDEPSKVFIGFEYGETDDEEEFDRNDITWCTIFIEESGQLKQVFDDETA